MRISAIFMAAILAVSLGGCASLTAESPLFARAPDSGPAAFTEGVWVEPSIECKLDALRAGAPIPEDCASLELRHESDDSWTVQTPAAPRPSDPDSEVVLARGVIASAVERDREGNYAPLYLYERVETAGSEDVIRYDVLVPIGPLPAQEMALIFEISCAEVLADGPIAGVREVRDEAGELVACVAQSQRAVREAVRRAAIENIGRLEVSRMVLLRPRSPPLVAER